ncbi:MAG: GIY-YIG nuclease family protein [SAR202 cluster bacterium]|jgi:tRNA/rRNA methyltransferase|nr:GIY-YIG nuclease family protein [SAR202 cluster bacterium]MDP7413643.1 GIY-YIG nuclease family protein [SAR202 cluster bacterium]
MSLHVYNLQCADGSYYTGHTEDLEARLAAHQSGAVSGYTRSRRPVTLVFSDSFATRIEALERERQIKRWSRIKKKALIDGDWALLRDLSGQGPSIGSPRTDVG